MAELNIYSTGGKQFKARPVFYFKNNVVQYEMDTVLAEGLALGLSEIVDNKHIGIAVKESTQLTPFIALKVLQFPFINLLWLGTILMVTGFAMSIVRRVKLLKRERAVQ
jgi:cytochrome c-type biogenesis protein CcmF